MTEHPDSPPHADQPPTELPPTAPAPSSAATADPQYDAGALSPQRGRSALPVLCALGFLLLLAAFGWLYYQQQGLEQALAEQAQHLDTLAQQPPPAPAIDPAKLAALDARIKVIEQRVAALAQPAPVAKAEPAPPPAKAEPAPPAGPPPASAAELAKLATQVAALEARKPPPPDTAGVVAPLAEKLDSMAAEVAAEKSAGAAATAKLADLDTRLKQAEQQQSAMTERATQAILVAHAQAALAAGQPVGDIPNAPPALARFAQTSPPTEADLRLSFPAAADAAEDASRPSTEGKTLGERMWLRARALVTVKRGDTVLVGAPAATVLAAAHARLEAGDLDGAVSALKQLDGAAAQAMAGWQARAQALVDARAALTQMARA